MHPAHVPLEAEAQPAVAGGAGDAGPRGRLLGDRDDAGHAAVDGGVHLLQEPHGLEVLATAVLVGRPLALLAGVVEVEHRGDAVDAQAVGVELLEPVERVGVEEVAHLVAAEVEDVGAPLLVPAALRVGVLVERGAVEAGQGPLVGGEVAGHPVEDDADAGLVQPVDEAAEAVGVAEPGVGGEVRGDVVAPRAAERVLHHRHQLDVGEAQVGQVGHQVVGQLVVGPVAPVEVLLPRARGAPRRSTSARAPGGARRARPSTPRRPTCGSDSKTTRGRARRHLGVPRHRVGLLAPRAVGAEHGELVAGAAARRRARTAPRPRAAELAHRVLPAVPGVEVGLEPHRAGRGRPDREGGAADRARRPALVVVHARAEHRPQLLVAALVDQVQVDLAEGGQEAVGVVD